MFDLVNIIKASGYFGLFAIIFAESGLFFGFFLPGDSLLFTAGFLASQGFLDIYILCALLFVAAVIGDNVGYAFGKKVGPKIFRKEESLLFKKDYVLKAENYFKKYGGKTIIIARFIPAVRTFVPIVAGVGNMQYRTFFFYNIVGGLIWAVGLTLAGYFLGSLIPNADKYILPIVALIIIVSVVPPIWQILRNKETRNKILFQLKSLFYKRK